MPRLFTILLAVTLTGPAFSMPICPPGSLDYHALLAGLKRNFNEVPVARAVLGDGSAIIERTANERETGFTLVIIEPDGTACILAAGNSWQAVTPKRGSGL